MEKEQEELLEKIIDLVDEKYLNHEDMDKRRRIIKLGSSFWRNSITKTKQKVDNLYIYAKYTEYYPILITSIEYREYFSIESGKQNIHKAIKLNEYYTHSNLSSEIEGYEFLIKDEKEDKQIQIIIFGQKFCTTIHGDSCFKDKKGLDKIFIGQLMGQNGNSAFQRAQYVDNSLKDYPIYIDSTFIKKKSDILSLITGKSQSLFRTNNIELKFQNRFLKEDEIAIKRRCDSNYIKIKESDFEQYKNEISKYYEPITYKQQERRLKDVELIKEEFDVICIGLGSAGTGILDQLARSTYVKNYMLIDFDTVEEKNLRNQWYSTSDVGSNKTLSSTRKITLISNYNQHAESFCGKYQDVNLKYMKSKYFISGFDNLECRLDIYNKIVSKEIETEYLIDLRYLDFECSVYMINVSDEKQMKHYENMLKADIESFKQQENNNKYIKTKEDFIKYWEEEGYFDSGCLENRIKFTKTRLDRCGYGICKSEECVNFLFENYINSDYRIEIKEENSCLKQNFIDIYKFASTFVFSAIREIEADKPKQFTHIECQTEGLPTYMVIKK